MTIDREIRKDRVLGAIVSRHIKSAIPIGSRHISRDLGLSSATIRNVMYELEKDGYIKQPYTSAGRIPTDLGYRRYVDNIMSVEEMSQESIFSKVKQVLNEKLVFEEIIEAISRSISRMTSYTSIVLSPNKRLYFNGAYHMLEHPEFQEMSIARDFIRAVEERENLLRIMNQDLDMNGTAIHIGRENEYEELRECTVITSSYRFRDKISGNIGVIGPIRMKYREVVPFVKCFADITTEILRGDLI